MCGHDIQQSTNQLRKVANPVYGQLNRGKFPCPRSRLRIWFRETGLAVPSLVSLLILYTTLNLVLGILPEFRGGVHVFLPAPHTIGSVPILSGHAIAYRWRSLPRVRWHRASSPQGSSSNGCCPCITMDQMLLCSSLFPHPLLIYSCCCCFVVSHIQRIGCQPEKTTLHGGQSRSWSSEQGKENKRKSLAAYPPPHPPHCSFGENK